MSKKHSSYTFNRKKRNKTLLIPSVIMMLLCLGLNVSVCVLDDNIASLVDWTELSGNFGLSEEDLEEIIIDNSFLNDESNGFFDKSEICNYNGRHKIGQYYREISTPPPEFKNSWEKT